MKFTLALTTGAGRHGKQEVARILRDVAERLERGDFRVPKEWNDNADVVLFDVKGKDVERAGFISSSSKSRSKAGRSH